jgi:hypothetical protein
MIPGALAAPAPIQTLLQQPNSVLFIEGCQLPEPTFHDAVQIPTASTECHPRMPSGQPGSSVLKKKMLTNLLMLFVDLMCTVSD